MYCGRRNDAAHDLAAFVSVVIPNAHESWLMLFWGLPSPLAFVKLMMR